MEKETATRTAINLPEHPAFPGIERKAIVYKNQTYYKYDGFEVTEKKVILDLMIFHFKDGVSFAALDNTILISTDKNDFINPQTMELVEKDAEGNYPDGSVCEYDFLWNLVNISKSKLPIELEELYILSRLPKINEKAYQNKL